MDKKKLNKIKEFIFYVLGILLIAGFVYLYWTRFVNKIALPPVIRKIRVSFGKNGVFIANAAVFILFLIFIPYRKKIEWKSKGIFSAFILALFAEMFGLPLLIYILSPYLGYELTINLPWFPEISLIKHYFILGWTGAVIGSYITLLGMILVFWGWIKIHKAEKLVKTGLYKYIRHPQYTGLFLIITGWLLHWANPLTIILYPMLVFMYYRLAKKEEKELIIDFEEKYENYMEETEMFIPYVL